jgi:hypothetical protein
MLFTDRDSVNKILPASLAKHTILPDAAISRFRQVVPSDSGAEIHRLCNNAGDEFRPDRNLFHEDCLNQTKSR